MHKHYALLMMIAVSITCLLFEFQFLNLISHLVDDLLLVWSFGDGDYGKLGRGGSEGCKYPIKIDSLVGLGVIKVECGSQVCFRKCTFDGKTDLK